MGVSVVPLDRSNWSWIRARAAPVLCDDTSGFVVLEDRKILGAVALDSWSKNSCQSHIAIEDPRITRRLVRAAFDFVFNYAGRGIMYGLTPGNNTEALRLNKGLGFQVVYRLEDGYAVGVDYVLQELRKENCRLLPKPMNHRKVA